MSLKDIRPYLIVAHVEWLDDSDEIPHIGIRNGEGVLFPTHLRDAPMLSFNISSEAVQNFMANEDEVRFKARFSGSIFEVVAPLDSVLFVRNKAGTVGIDLSSHLSEPDEAKTSKKPELSVVRNPNAEAVDTPAKKANVFTLVPKKT